VRLIEFYLKKKEYRKSDGREISPPDVWIGVRPFIEEDEYIFTPSLNTVGEIDHHINSLIADLERVRKTGHVFLRKSQTDFQKNQISN
jgi:hypothetical protein